MVLGGRGWSLTRGVADRVGLRGRAGHGKPQRDDQLGHVLVLSGWRVARWVEAGWCSRRAEWARDTRRNRQTNQTGFHGLFPALRCAAAA
eukprot:5067074-Prymnesium_polylepis.1